MSKYLGITIGPIGESLDKANNPAGLWFVSSLFSHISFMLCEKIKEKFQNEMEQILSPFFDDVKQGDNFISDGVGKYHDRVIVSLTNEIDKEEIVSRTQEIIENVKKDIVNDFEGGIDVTPANETFLMDYLQIHFSVLDEDEALKDYAKEVETEKENILLRISPYLDALELMQTKPANDDNNPFDSLLFVDTNIHTNTNANICTNSKILCSGLYKKILKDNRGKILEEKNNTIKSIGDIAKGNGTDEGIDVLKKYVYFAVVQADGDNMGKLLKTINKEADIKSFSETCLKHAKEAANEIGKYGGMPIYAGGDDLLFLAPIENNGETVFDLCERLDDNFKNFMESLYKEEKKQIPSLSFGIAIQYYRYPLYEARRTACDLLFGVAKQHPNKNTMAIKLQKHSGQTIGVRMMVEQYGNIKLRYRTAFEELRSNNSTMVNSVNSAIRTLQKNKKLLNVLENDIRQQIKSLKDKSDNNEQVIPVNCLKERFLTAWSNFQDNPGQKQYAEYFRTLGEIYFDYFIDAEVDNELKQDNERDEIVKEMEARGENTEKFKKDYKFKRNIASIGDFHEDINESLQGFISYLNIEKFLKEKRQEGEYLPREEDR